jgi:transposase
MVMAYSNDLRTSAVTYFLNSNLRFKDVAAIFMIGVATLHEWVKRFQETGGIEVKKSTGRPRLLPVEKHAEFEEFIRSNADNTLEQLSEKWYALHGEKLSIFCIYRSIKRIGFSYKKNVSRVRTRQCEIRGQTQ